MTQGLVRLLVLLCALFLIFGLWYGNYTCTVSSVAICGRYLPCGTVWYLGTVSYGKLRYIGLVKKSYIGSSYVRIRYIDGRKHPSRY